MNKCQAKNKKTVVHHGKDKGSEEEAHHFFNNQEFKEKIAKKAYELYEYRGGIPGRDIDDWLEAERIVKNEWDMLTTSVEMSKICPSL